MVPAAHDAARGGRRRMSESIRAFLAVDLPHSVRETLAGLADELREARIRGLRPVNPDGIHLTLKFLGDIPAAQAETIANCDLQRGRRAPPLQRRACRAGSIPKRAAAQGHVGRGGRRSEVARGLAPRHRRRDGRSGLRKGKTLVQPTLNGGPNKRRHIPRRSQSGVGKHCLAPARTSRVAKYR